MKQTRYPIFNLVRLMRGPCEVVGCVQHMRPKRWMLAKGAAVLCYMTFWFVIDRSYAWDIWTTIGMNVSFFCLMHIAYSEAWNAHAKDCKALRDQLLAKTSTDLLMDELERIIRERREALIGDASPLAVWLKKFDGNGEEVRSAQEALHEKSRVRLAYRASDRLAQGRELKEWASGEFELLIRRAWEYIPATFYFRATLCRDAGMNAIYDCIDHIASRLTYFVEQSPSDASDTDSDPVPDASAPGKRSAGNS